MPKIYLKNYKGELYSDIEQLATVTVSAYICTFIFADGKKFHQIETLKNAEQKLGAKFVRISRNTMINSDKIDYIDSKKRKVSAANHIFDISSRKMTIFTQILQRKRLKTAFLKNTLIKILMHLLFLYLCCVFINNIY